ncbi:2-phosphosulfolactate phosphatase [Aneurinibacillus sp. UBA3580]|jgi:2-phosphosulfolactate phosphatase|uniref:2-phosphosulfolactate phosphatase n=1 Tax=Aneurinibacillus sp. UBA3580 TaxID=1946041 RepID=UPI002580C194|nr:2-phosphosulfolactate phosphatase [Aneurinibacillus sp. UBA3580]
MRKIHVLTQKESLNPERLSGCTAVVIDVLYATSTIVTALHHGARAVIPVLHREDALQTAAAYRETEYLLCGESGGYTLDQFVNPDPLELATAGIHGKTIIFSSTNGTVALKKAATARTVYASSLLNGHAVADHIRRSSEEGSIVIICAGSNGRFALEDMLGAGYLIQELTHHNPDDWQLSDGAFAARELFASCADRLSDTLLQTETGRFLEKLGGAEGILHAAQAGTLPVVPLMHGGALMPEKTANKSH